VRLGCVSAKISSRYLGALQCRPSGVKDNPYFFIFIFLQQQISRDIGINGGLSSQKEGLNPALPYRRLGTEGDQKPGAVHDLLGWAISNVQNQV